MPAKRQLAAIMFTDIVGYTMIMGDSEDKALQLLQKNQKIQKSLIEKFGGKYLKEIGDGVLASFNSASDAVFCALAIQNVTKYDSDLTLRVGIHLGDVIFKKKDVLGDGVNITSRIADITPPSEIYVSDTVFKNIKNLEGVNTELIAEENLKNVDEPVIIYKVKAAGAEQIEPEFSYDPPEVYKNKANKLSKFQFISLIILLGAILVFYFIYTQIETEPEKEKAIPTNIEKSVAVLPFSDMSPNKDQEYFSDGMMEEILTHLYKIGGIKVTSRISSMQYKQVDQTIPEIGNELGVAHILTGSVRKDEGRVRISVQLIDVTTDQQIWAENYDRDFSDVFSIQSEVAKQIANILKAEISPEVVERIEVAHTNNIEAYNLFLQGHYYLYQNPSFEKARTLLEKALNLDPNMAPAYADLGYYWLVQGSWVGDLRPENLLENALANLNIALKLDENYAVTHVYLSMIYLWYQWDFNKAEDSWNEFYRLNPSSIEWITNYVDLLNASGKFEKALIMSKKAIKIDPNSAANWSGTGLSYYFSGEPENAIQHYYTAINLFSTPTIMNEAGRIFLYTGNYSEVISILNKYLESSNLRPPRTIGNKAIAFFHLNQLDSTQSILAELIERSSKSPVGSPSFYIAMVYAQMGKIDKAFTWLDKAYESREVEMYWLKVDPLFLSLHSDSRWIDMIEKIGIP